MKLSSRLNQFTDKIYVIFNLFFCFIKYLLFSILTPQCRFFTQHVEPVVYYWLIETEYFYAHLKYWCYFSVDLASIPVSDDLFIPIDFTLSETIYQYKPKFILARIKPHYSFDDRSNKFILLHFYGRYHRWKTLIKY